jgi:hypothetical protein
MKTLKDFTPEIEAKIPEYQRRAERLQSISESDAIAEGIKDHSFWRGIEYLNYLNEEWESNPIRSYLSLWDKINGSDAHKINPWVWAVTFKRIKP